MAQQIEVGPLCSDSTHNTLKTCFNLAPQIELGPSCSDSADSMYPTLLSSPRHAHGSSAESLETQTQNSTIYSMGTQKVCFEAEKEEESQRMPALIKTVKTIMAQPGAAPKRHVQRASMGQGAMVRTLSMGSLIDAVRMAMQKPGDTQKYIEPTKAQCMEPEKAKGSQRMTALIKAVKMDMAQSGAAPKRYVRRANVGQGAMNRTLPMDFLIDVVRMAFQVR